ncbi:MAG: LysE family transporter [Hyphomicrobiales bacterium]|nr:LysE family transporter [Hyphomicrobiales bacterium]
MSLETWLVFLVVSIVPVISPGPAILLAVSNTLRYGGRATVFSALGNMFGLVLVGFAVAFGLAAIMAASALAFTVVKVIGAAYLIWLGVKVWRDRGALEVADGGPGLAKSRRRLFWEAFFVSVTNPKAIIILAALIPPFIDPAKPAFAQVAILSTTYAVMCFINHLMIAAAGARVRRFLQSERRMAHLRRALGAMFIGFGAALATASR